MSTTLVEEILERAEEPVSRRERAVQLLEPLVRTIGADAAVFVLEYQHDQIVGVDIDDHVVRGAFNYYLDADEKMEETRERARAAEAHGGGVFIDNEIFTVAERGSMPYFTEVRPRLGAASQLVGVVSFRGATLGRVALLRSAGSRDFAHRELRALSQALPALGFAYSMAVTSTRGPQLPGLSPRELQLASLVANGLPNSDIALIVGASCKNVRSDLQRISSKLGTSTRTQLALVTRGALQLSA